MKQYGKIIAKLRKERNMTQAELGAKLNVTYQAVSKWENDQSQPDFATMIEMAKLFNVPLNVFVDGDEASGPAADAAGAAVPAAEAPQAERHPAEEPVIGYCKNCGIAVRKENLAQERPYILCSNCATELAERVGKNWGLKRGKIGSTARHVEAAEYTANEMMRKAKAAADDTRRHAEQYLDRIVQSVESTADKPIPTKRKHAEDEIKTLRTQNAALQKSLDIKSKDAADLFEQLQRAERLGKGKDTAFRMVSDMIAACPDEFDALLQKSRAAKSPFPAKSKQSGKDGK